jgi:hypothetical protein
VLSALAILESIEAQLIGTGGAVVRRPVIEVDDFSGYDVSGRLALSLEYPFGHRFHAAVVVDVSYGYPLWSSYSFQFSDRHGKTVLRYDNASHHPELATFPDHKHVGESEVPRAHQRPSLSALVEEIRQVVSPEGHP